jgi:hypothetical protein
MQLALPETTVTVQGDIKTIVEWYLNDEGKRVKKTTKYKLVQRPCRIKTAVLQRREAALFGKAVTQGNTGGITRMDTEVEINVTAKQKALEAEAAFREAWKQRKQASAEKWGVRDYSKKKEADDFWQTAREGFYGEGADAEAGSMKMRDQGNSKVRASARSGSGG